MNETIDPNDTEAIKAANLRMVRALSPEEWRAANVEVNRLYRALYKGRTIPYPEDPEGTLTFEKAARYRLAHLAARILLDMTEHAVLTDDRTHMEEFADALKADGRIPEPLLADILPVLGNMFTALAPLLPEVFRAAEGASSAIGELAAAGRDE